MKKSPIPALWAALVVLGFACAKHSYNMPVSQRPTLQGTWVINALESGTPEFDRPLPEDRMRRPGGEGVRAGTIGVGRRGGQPPGIFSGNVESLRWATEHLRDIGSRIELTLTDSSVAISYADTTTLTLPTNGKEQKLTWRRVGEIEAKAAWEEAGLRIERKLEGGVKIRETFWRTPDSSRLIVDLEVDGPLRDLKFKRVYEADKQSGPGPAPDRPH